MSDTDWEEALETVIAGLEHPPEPGTGAGRDFDAALRRVLAGAPAASHGASSVADVVTGLHPGLRERLDDLARRRTGTNPFGDHPDGIGPTLGMDLGGARDPYA